MKIDHYIAVFQSGEKAVFFNRLQIENLTPEHLLFICKKESIISYRYGEHAHYIFCDIEGDPTPFVVGDITLFKFKTHGSQRCFILSWEFKESGVHKEYSLYRDNVWYLRPTFDYEWTNPISDTVKFIQDLRSIGLDSRKELDRLKRNIYARDSKIISLKDKHYYFSNIDYSKCGLNIIFYNVSLPLLEEEYSKIAEKMARSNIKSSLQFLADELFKRESSIKQLEEGNEKYKHIISGLNIIYIKDGVTDLLKDQFNDCNNVVDIYLPPSIERIENNAFNYLSKLERVHISSQKMVNLIPSFPNPGSMLTKAQFYVSDNLVDSYKTDLFWKEKAEKICGVPID